MRLAANKLDWMENIEKNSKESDENLMLINLILEFTLILKSRDTLKHKNIGKKKSKISFPSFNVNLLVQKKVNSRRRLEELLSTRIFNWMVP